MMTKSATLGYLGQKTSLSKKQIGDVLDELLALACKEAKNGFVVPGVVVVAWVAFAAASGTERLIGALGAGRNLSDAMLHGPVVIAETEQLEIAAQLVAAALDHATASGIATVFARPQGLDRVWVRYGFIPVPESTLPAGLARP